MAYTMRDFLDRKITELIQEEGYSPSGAEEIARNIWNDELTEAQRLQFNNTGFIEKEVDNSHPVLQKMENQKKAIEENINKKDYYPSNNMDIKLIEDQIMLIKQGTILDCRNKKILIIPKNCAFKNKINRLITLLSFFNEFSGNKTDEDLLKDLRKIEEVLKK